MVQVRCIEHRGGEPLRLRIALSWRRRDSCLLLWAIKWELCVGLFRSLIIALDFEMPVSEKWHHSYVVVVERTYVDKMVWYLLLDKMHDIS